MNTNGPANVAVLVHGGTLTSIMWDAVRSQLASPSVAVDLPGRRYKPADLAEITIGDWVTSVVADIEQAGLSDVSWTGFPTDVPRTYVRALRDKVIPPELADRMITAMGGVKVIDLDAGHRSYDTHPAELAALIDACCDNTR